MRPGFGATDPTREGHGLSMAVAVRPATEGQIILGNPGDFSWSGAFGTTFWVDPKDELAVVFMAQTPGLIRQNYHRLINSLVYQAIVEQLARGRTGRSAVVPRSHAGSASRSGPVTAHLAAGEGAFPSRTGHHAVTMAFECPGVMAHAMRLARADLPSVPG